MGTNRDDFTRDTVRKAAGRVGYRCSFPGCPNVTIGASMESADKTAVTGVAAHICAAAPGGPRYDESMTVAERRSIENWEADSEKCKPYLLDLMHYKLQKEGFVLVWG